MRGWLLLLIGCQAADDGSDDLWWQADGEVPTNPFADDDDDPPLDGETFTEAFRFGEGTLGPDGFDGEGGFVAATFGGDEIEPHCIVGWTYTTVDIPTPCDDCDGAVTLRTTPAVVELDDDCAAHGFDPAWRTSHTLTLGWADDTLWLHDGQWDDVGYSEVEPSFLYFEIFVELE